MIYLFARFLYGQQATTRLQNEDMLGKTARVVVTIRMAASARCAASLARKSSTRSPAPRTARPCPRTPSS
jgi:hypothetical protein